MAIFRTSPIIGAISGKLGGMVFVAGKGSPTVRPRPRRSARNSQFQLQATADYVTISQSWKELTTLQKDAWRTSAISFPTKNRLGVSAPISGFQLFVKFHAELQNRNIISADPPPVQGTNGIPTSVSATFSAAGDLDVAASPQAGLGADRWIVYGSIYFRNHDARNVRRWITIDVDTGISYTANVRTSWEAHFGAPVEDQRFSIGVACALNTLFRSPLVIIDGTVAA